MTIVTGTVRNVGKKPDRSKWYFSSELRESGADGKMVVSTNLVVATPNVDGLLTVELDPGPVTVKYGNNVVRATVPDDDVDLWDLISAGVLIPPAATDAKIAAAAEAYLTALGPVVAKGNTKAAARAAINAAPADDNGRLLSTNMPADGAAARAAIGAASLADVGLADRVAPHGMVEYGWIKPTSVYLAEPYRHTLLAALGDSNGTSTPLLLMDVSHESGAVNTYPIGFVPADDHNSPSVITEPGDPIVYQWTTHGLDNLLRYRVGLPDRPDTLVTAPDQTADMGAITAYGQAWKVASLSDDTKVTYYRLYRRNLVEWYLLKEEVNRATLQITTNAPGTKLYSSIGLQCYITNDAGSRDGQIRRLICGTNPSSDPDWVLYFELNSATGAITTPLDGTFTANLNGTNLPITPAAYKTQLLPNLSGSKAAYERRMLAVRPYPAALGVLTAEGDPNNRAGTAHYWLHEWGGAHDGGSTGDPASATGLIVPTAAGAATSIVKTTGVTLANGATGFRVTTKLKLPASKPAVDWLDICGQMNDAASDSGWQLWLGASAVGNELRPRLLANRVGNTTQTATATSALSGLTWGADVWIRATYTVASTGSPARRVTFESSPDGTTWTEIGAIAGNSGALVVASDAYTWIGGRASGRSYGLVVRSAKIEIGGVTKADLDFTNDSTGWPGYATAYTDALSNAWSLVGAAVVGRTAYGPTNPSVAVPVSHDLGLTGGSLWSSYYPGAAFSGASILLARANGANQELVLSDFATGVLRETVLRTQPTTAGKFFRPMPPTNGGPLWCWLVNATDYGSNDFYDWESSAIAVRRL